MLILGHLKEYTGSLHNHVPLLWHIPTACQDNAEEFRNLPCLAQLNVHCDSTAKHKIWELTKELLHQKSIPPKPVTVWIGDDKLTSDAANSFMVLGTQTTDR